MNIKVIRKQNMISVAGNQFQATGSSSPLILATYSGDYVDIVNQSNNKYVVKGALYSDIVDEADKPLGPTASDVVDAINGYVRDENPDRVIVKPTSINDGDLMYWKADPGGWYPSSRSNLLGGQSIGALSDVYLDNVQDGQTLVYSYVRSRFENAQSGASSSDYSVNEMFMIFLEK